MIINKKVKTPFVLFLCGIIMVTSLLGCKKDNNNQGDDPIAESTTHIRQVEVKDSFILQNGYSPYKLVVPSNATNYESYAASEFALYFEEATSFKLQIVKDEGLSFTDTSKYISVGNTSILNSAGLSFKEEDGLGKEGYIIETVGDSIFIYGADRGKVYGVYEFLGEILNLAFYSHEYYDIKKWVNNINFIDCYIKEVPDIATRSLGWAFLDEDVAKLGLRITPNWQVDGVGGHNALTVVNKNLYFEDHPEYYYVNPKMGVPTQLCFTGHGSEQTVNEMVDISVEFFKEKLIADKNQDHYVIGLCVEDGTDSCQCESCLEMARYYNPTDDPNHLVYAASYIKFVNKVHDKLWEWLDSDEGKPYSRNGNVAMRIYAYSVTDKAPAKYDAATDTYAPIDDSVVLRPGVIAMIACWNADYTVPYTEEINHEPHLKNIKGWAAICENVFFYLYVSNYHYFMAPFNSFSSIQGNHRLAYDMNVQLYYTLGKSQMRGYSTGWDMLKIYLTAQYGWNVEYDYDTLVDKFFDGYFKDAAPYMREWFEDFRVHMLYIHNAFGKNSYTGWYQDPLKTNFWPEAKLQYWLECADKALMSIEYLKRDDPKLHQQLEKHILAETVSVWWLYIGLYSKNMHPDDLLAKKLELKDLILNRLGMTHHRDNGTIDAIFTSWGV